MNGEYGDLSALVEFMLVQPGMIDSVLAAHTPDHNGDCNGCGGQRRVRWQCVHHECATAAKTLRDGGALGR